MSGLQGLGNATRKVHLQSVQWQGRDLRFSVPTQDPPAPAQDTRLPPHHDVFDQPQMILKELDSCTERTPVNLGWSAANPLADAPTGFRICDQNKSLFHHQCKGKELLRFG